MPEARALTESEITARMPGIPGWSLADGKLQRQLRFPSFVQAFGFIAALALVAERMNHHPEILNVYDRVTLTLWTHDTGGLSALDFALAEAVNRLLP
jgi:4a-hydroxytetrahydrobiopterin dehydratase